MNGMDCVTAVNPFDMKYSFVYTYTIYNIYLFVMFYSYVYSVAYSYYTAYKISILLYDTYFHCAECAATGHIYGLAFFHHHYGMEIDRLQSL